MSDIERFHELGLVPTKDTLPFWEGLVDRGELTMCRCRACGRFRMPPSGFCPACQSPEVEWVKSAGRGTVYTWTVATHGFTPELKGEVPYVIVLVELDDCPGTRLIASLRDIDHNDIHIGAAVQYDDRRRAEARLDFVPVAS